MKRYGKRLLSMILVGGMLTACLAGCSGGSDDTTAASSGSSAGSGGVEASGETLVVGVQSSVISVPTVYAEEQGYFDDLGLDVELVVFPNGSPENEGLAAEQLDIASNGLASVFSMSSGLCAWVGETDTIGESTWIMARPDNEVFTVQGEDPDNPDMYGSAETAKGQSILGITSTIQQQVAAAYMAKFDLTSDDYEFLNMEQSAAVQAFIGGEGDMIVVTDYIYLDKLEQAGMKRVASYQQATDGEFLNGILARKDVLESRRGDVELFLTAMYQAAEELQNDPELRKEFSKQFYEENGKDISDEALDAEVEGRTYVTKEYMQSDDYVMGQGMVAAGEFFASVGTIEEDQVDNVKTAIDSSLISDIFGIQVNTAG